MSDPVRLLEEGDVLEVQVLRSATGDVAPTRVRDGVLAIGVGSVVTTGTAAASASMAAGLKGSSVVGAVGMAKWVAITIVAGAAVAGAVTYGKEVKTRQKPALSVEPAPIAPSAPITPAKNATATTSPPAPPAMPAPTALAVSPRSAPSTPQRVVRGATLLDELSLLDGAREALEAGDVELATERLDRHDREYSKGQLASDALALRVEVYAKRQDDPKVRELAQRFLSKYPEHPQAPKVRGLLDRAGRTNP